MDHTNPAAWHTGVPACIIHSVLHECHRVDELHEEVPNQFFVKGKASSTLNFHEIKEIALITVFKVNASCRSAWSMPINEAGDELDDVPVWNRRGVSIVSRKAEG